MVEVPKVLAREVKRCVRTCSFDKAQGKCVSCDRTIDEIRQAYVDYKRSLEEKYLDTTIPVEK